VSEECEEKLCCRGRPISGPEVVEVRLALLLVACVARLNMCGMRARLKVDAVLPSVGCICWYASNSTRRALSVLRKSYAAAALAAADDVELLCACMSRTGGMERPRRR